jgi:hypothetical protein
MGGGVAAHEAAEAAAAAAAPPRGVVETDVASGGCHRKFEPGFLDSNATVCVTGACALSPPWRGGESRRRARVR